MEVTRDRVLCSEFHVVPSRVDSSYGMLSTNERHLLYKLTKDHYSGAGYIVDAGSFVGSSTVALAEGLRDNTRATFSGRPIVSYDIGFLPAPPTAQKAITKDVGGVMYTWGESFVPILKKNTAGLDDIIEFRIGDFLQEKWSADKPIEICFIDLAKTNDLNIHSFRELFPAFIPGTTLLVQQDFFFDKLPWIKVLMGYLDDHFEWLGQVGPSSLYRYKRAIPKELYRIDPYTDLPLEERISLHKRADKDVLPVRRRFALAMSLCYLCATEGRDRAIAEAENVKERFADHMAKDASAARRYERALDSFRKGRKE